MENNECQICIEKYNKTTKNKIICPYCSFEACQSCYRTFLLNENISHCMNNECNREWTRQFLFKMFSKNFLNNTFFLKILIFYKIL